MFNDIFTELATTRTPRILVHTDQYIKTLRAQVESAISRSKNGSGLDHPGVGMLVNLIDTANMSIICSDPDLTSRATSKIDPILTSLEKVFDPTYKDSATFGKFIQTLDPRASVLMPARCDLLMKIFTSDLKNEDWDVWKRVSPLRLIDHDSDELSFHTYTDVLRFRTDVPTFAFMTLDVRLLLMQYSVFLNTVKGADRVMTRDYLHRYVIAPKLMLDSVNIWLEKRYGEIINDPDTDISHTQDYTWLTANFGHMGLRYTEGMTDVVTMVGEVYKGNLSTPRFMGSLPLLTRSVSSYAVYNRENVGFPDLRQYKWAALLRDFRFLEMALTLSQRNLSIPENKSIHSILMREIPYVYYDKPWQSIRNPILRDQMTDKLTRLYDIVKSS